ncbi:MULTISPECIES: hypothetical protein [unclassified Pseudomonas]|uniref:hypothetical protein n=1 Tax=unclassified Pseudomonas TaxID=196821 RepID=UPI001C60F1CF|nr:MULTISPECIES: hypothetical protein [unclassified Pseudomonas]MBW5416058.1 hypothetical protein [Pseudomonas sp. MAG002Y]
MSQFKPGDAAWIAFDVLSENIGKSVECVMRVEPEDMYPFDGDMFFNTTSHPAWIVTGDVVSLLLTGEYVRNGRTMLPEPWLRPLGGDFSHEIQERIEELAHE